MNNKIIITLVLVVLAYSAVISTVLLLKAPEQIAVPVGAEGDTNLTNLVLSGDLTVDGASTQTGIATFTGTTTHNGLDCRVLSGSLANATTTVVSQKNPTGATSTLLARVVWSHTGTSTHGFTLGTSTTGFIDQADATFHNKSIVKFAVLSTSTKSCVISGVGQQAVGTLCASAGGDSPPLSIIGPTEYVVGLATSSVLAGNDGWTTSVEAGGARANGIIGNNNAYAGTYTFQFCTLE